MAKDQKISELRSHYGKGMLLEAEVSANPFTQFNRWMQEAILENLFEPNALTLATVGEDGQPSCRTVLLKGLVEEGFIFYTNYNSKKGRHLAENNKAAMLFWWREHERQVRIEGKVIKVPAEMSSDYFQERPIGSRISAIISPQSEVIPGREVLERSFQAAQKKYQDEEPTCPDNWGGYLLQPELFEFWQGRPNRLHDRLEYQPDGTAWKIVRLAP